MNRRTFLKATAGSMAVPAFLTQRLAAQPALSAAETERIRAQIDRQRPSRLKQLPPDFNARVGAAHVAGKYHLTSKPFLIEGAEKLLELGTRLGKFWFMPNGAAHDYPFNSQWGQYANFVELAKSEYFASVFAMPFATIFLEAHSPVEQRWRSGGNGPDFYERVTREFYDLTAHLYRTCRERQVTFILQHWEGDWFVRGRGGELWNPPPSDWRELCQRMVKWLSARQAGVTKARAEFGAGSKCRVAHATEVNRVVDFWNGIPTMVEHVLPNVEMDLISYSAYDGLKDGLTLWRCLEEIRKHARTGPLFGPGAICVGEIGRPENEKPDRLVEHWDEWLGAAFAAKALYVVHWELYCNEPAKSAKDIKPPLNDPAQLRGFWLVKPDGSLGESGKYLAGLWKRAQSLNKKPRMNTDEHG
jgi:hypothetical protein